MSYTCSTVVSDAHTRTVVALKYSKCGEYFASASADKTCAVFRSSSGQKLATLSNPHTLGLNDCAWIDSNLLVTASDDKTVNVWDVTTGKCINTLQGHKSFVYSLATNPLNHLVLSGGYDGAVRMFDILSGKCVHYFDAHSEPIAAVDFSNGGNAFATGGHDGIVRFWDANSYVCKKSFFHEGDTPVSSISYTSNGDYILVSTLDDTHRLYGDIIPGSTKPRCMKLYKGHSNRKYNIFATTYYRNNKSYVVSGSENNLIYIWDANDRSVVTTLDGHNDVVLAIACNPNPLYNQIISAGIDMSIRIHDCQEL